MIASMTATSMIISLLAERPEDELRKLQREIQQELARLEVEAQQVEQALARKTRRSPSRSTRRAPKAGGTRKRLLDAVAAHDGPISPSEIIDALRQQGVTVSAGSIHNMIGRLTRGGELTRVAEGQYTLASQDNSEPEASVEPSSNGEAPPLSLAEPSHSQA